jgi:urease gamma subunit
MVIAGLRECEGFLVGELDPASLAAVVEAQALVVFGQGLESCRVSRSAVLAFRRHWAELRLAPEELERWDEVAVHVLEWVRTVGRLAAQLALSRGEACVAREDVLAAFESVVRHARVERWPSAVR